MQGPVRLQRRKRQAVKTGDPIEPLSSKFMKIPPRSGRRLTSRRPKPSILGAWSKKMTFACDQYVIDISVTSL